MHEVFEMVHNRQGRATQPNQITHGLKTFSGTSDSAQKYVLQLALYRERHTSIVEDTVEKTGGGEFSYKFFVERALWSTINGVN